MRCLHAAVVVIVHYSIGLYHLGVFMTLHWFDKDGAAADLDHDHDVLVSLFGSGWKLSGLIGEHCFGDIVRRYVDVLNLLTSHFWVLVDFEWDLFNFS